MPIKKFLSVKNVGRLVNCTQKGPELSRYNLFFAENGRGKTTLCAVLRSLQTGEYEHISERTTIAPVTNDSRSNASPRCRKHDIQGADLVHDSSRNRNIRCDICGAKRPCRGVCKPRSSHEICCKLLSGIPASNLPVPSTSSTSPFARRIQRSGGPRRRYSRICRTV